MALSARARTVTTVAGVVVLLGAAATGYLLFTGKSDALPFLGGTRDEPVLCPLTQTEATNEKLASRPLLAVKVENSPESRPQAGLQQADVVYEEPVEGGYTRFVALYQCDNASRIGPIRSARFADPNILVQYGQSLLAYSGGIPEVIQDIRESGLIQDLGFDSNQDLYIEDPNHAAPHNLYSSTKTFYAAGKRAGGPPDSVFEFDDEPPAKKGSKKATELHLAFSSASDVTWGYRRATNDYARAHTGTPHVMEDGEQVTASNVVVMEVELVDTGIIDPAGNPSPEVMVTGSGTAYVFRDGRVIEGTWARTSLDDPTVITDANGEVIPLAPGRTWVELFPSTNTIEFE